MKKVVLFLITVYGAVPVLLHLFPWVLGHAIYCHLVKYPFFVDLTRPEDFLNHTRNFYLDTEEGVSVGVWHTLPASQWKEAAGKSLEWYRETLGDSSAVIIYLHGNTGTRAIDHRVQLLKILSAAGYHVLTLDYRGFGDSTGEPSEAGLTTDALYLHQWAKRQSRGGPVYLWGHSLGTGVATNTAVKLQEQGSVVDAVVLEAPFTKIGDVIIRFQLLKLHMLLPGFERFILDVLERNNIELANNKNLETLKSPLLILHAEDDYLVHHDMGLKLYQIALHTKKKLNSDARVEMVSFSADLGLSHDNIYLDPNLPNVIQNFLTNP
ncbi:uncharacterized protein V6R79_023910 [Siganus canaliculatus]